MVENKEFKESPAVVVQLGLELHVRLGGWRKARSLTQRLDMSLEPGLGPVCEEPCQGRQSRRWHKIGDSCIVTATISDAESKAYFIPPAERILLGNRLQALFPRSPFASHPTNAPTRAEEL